MKLQRSKCLMILIASGVISVLVTYFQIHRFLPLPALFSSEGLEHAERQHLAERAKKLAAQHHMADILRLLPGKKKPYVPVFIVEEHFEVLKHWFDAVKVGVVPETGNTLLHIDGHSDAAVPMDDSIIPLFHPPQDHSEIASMMQSNDVFIAGAALAGLIKRYIWVWPAWDEETHKNESDHEVYDLRVGWHISYPKNSEPVRELCGCSRYHFLEKAAGSELPEWECRIHNKKSPDPSKGQVISSTDCTIEMTGLVEVVKETKAAELLQAGGWITEKDHLLLDIDEDYYGCESSVMPLYKASLPQDKIDSLSQLWSTLLCVKTVQQEYSADLFFQSVIETILKLKISECRSDHSRGTCLTDFDLDKALIEMIPRFFDNLHTGKFKGLLCSENGKSNNVIMQIILRIMEDLTITQLKALDYVGLCLETAPTNYFFEDFSLHVCHGFNTPNQTEVTFHVPDEAENERRTNLLQRLISLLPAQPLAITVCRSMRDGYTPWRHFEFVENAILTILQDEFNGVHQGSFHYDVNLLGGKKGWPNRHKK